MAASTVNEYSVYQKNMHIEESAIETGINIKKNKPSQKNK